MMDLIKQATAEAVKAAYKAEAPRLFVKSIKTMPTRNPHAHFWTEWLTSKTLFYSPGLTFAWSRRYMAELMGRLKLKYLDRRKWRHWHPPGIYAERDQNLGVH